MSCEDRSVALEDRRLEAVVLNPELPELGAQCGQLGLVTRLAARIDHEAHRVRQGDLFPVQSEPHRERPPLIDLVDLEGTVRHLARSAGTAGREESHADEDEDKNSHI